MSRHRSNVLVIGGGPAGYTAAIYAARAGLSTVLVAGPQPGGQLTITTDVENFPGFPTPVQGPWLMEQMKAQAENVGVRIVDDVIAFCDASQSPVRAGGELGEVFVAEALIVATGAQARWLGVPGELTYRSRGVSACAVCDGVFFRDKRVAVIGGGSSAVEEALLLANHAAHVTLIHRGATLRAEKILQDRLFAHPKIEVVWNRQVREIVGGVEKPDHVGAVRLADTVSGEESTLGVDGVFVAIGHTPSSGLFRGQIALDEAGYVEVGAWSTRTSLPWVHACGDVADRKYRQAVTAAGMGCMAALETERFLAAADDASKATRLATDVAA